MIRTRSALAAIVAAAVVVGSVVTLALRGSTSPPAAGAAAPPSVGTATVARTDLSTTVLTEGTLGYAPTDPVVNRTPGTYTDLPTPGATIQTGEALYRVDNLPVVLMAGTTPVWRPFAPGMTDGPDVRELQTDLVTLGDAAGLFTTATGHFDTLTTDAVKRWQAANGYPADGQLSLGEVVFLPGPVLVGADEVAPGQAASPGDVPFQVTTTSRVVTVALNPNLPSVSVGEAVSIVLPTNTTTPGKITAIGPAPPSSSAGSQGPQSGSSQASVLFTVTPDDPAATGTGAGVAVQVSLTTQSVRDVLAAPISALLALAGGGYGVEVVGRSGLHHLVGVSTGVFTGSRVAITGTGIEAGTKVVVSQ